MPLWLTSTQTTSHIVEKSESDDSHSDTMEDVPLKIEVRLYKGSVKELSLKALCQVIDEFLGQFAEIDDPHTVLSSIQAQQSLYRVLLDSAVQTNFQILASKDMGHAVVRASTSREPI
ncbi:unnamed protein product [Phytophthora fragariaefolia]|uniref:Unnamed protein product n=1 Tax=Phytophthora fragariaefolia TaxID=1490495 RepID=A0A9W6XIE4_9STRA|nr:unnamed protein product [Phytophthora fragariaefolia]